METIKKNVSQRLPDIALIVVFAVILSLGLISYFVKT